MVFNDFAEHIRENFPSLRKTKFHLACSGGLDSVVLAHLCARMNLDFDLVHCNFKLRGKESDADEEYVKEFAETIAKKIIVEHFDTDSYAKINKVSIQVAARELRYEWFSELRREKGIDFTLTAHHADDDLETFIINLSRGSGLDGLCGIPERSGNVLRPLLPFSREQLSAYAKSQKISWREDSSNLETKYLRNKVRQLVIPALKELRPDMLSQFKKTKGFLLGSSLALDNYAEGLRAELFEPWGKGFRIPIEKLKELQPFGAHLYLLFKPYGFTAWDDLEKLVKASSGKWIFSPDYRLLKDRTFLILEAQHEEFSGEFEIPRESAMLEEPLPIKISVITKMQATSEKILYLDKETLNHRLTIRKWRKGDYFYPIGMKGRKKVAKFLKDLKMDRFSKERQWVLCCGEDITWVVGLRADDRFKVTEGTREILKIELLT